MTRFGQSRRQLRFYAGDGQRSPSLNTVISSCLADYDATISQSYPGTGQTLFNLVTGSTESDLWLGADGSVSTDDPAFSGTANDPAAEFQLDGGDYFQVKTISSFLNSLHKTTGGTNYWFAFAIYLPNDAAGDILFGNQDSTRDGIFIQIRPTPTLRIAQYNGSTIATVDSVTTQATEDAVNIIIVSFDNSAGQATFWANSSTGETRAFTMNTATNDPTDDATFFARAGTLPANNGVDIYGFSYGNEYLNDTKAGDLIGAYEARHNRDYTP